MDAREPTLVPRQVNSSRIPTGKRDRGALAAAGTGDSSAEFSRVLKFLSPEGSRAGLGERCYSIRLFETMGMKRI